MNMSVIVVVVCVIGLGWMEILMKYKKDPKHCEVEVSLVSRTCAAHGYRSITPIKPQISMQPIFILTPRIRYSYCCSVTK